MTHRVDGGQAAAQGLSRSLLPIAILALIWGCNWPVLKLGVAELPPLTFRGLTLPFAALGMLAVAYLSGDVITIPRGVPHWFKQVDAPFTYYVVKDAE